MFQNLSGWLYPVVALVFCIIAYHLVKAVLRTAARLTAAIIALPAGIMLANALFAHFNIPVNLDYYSRLLSNIIPGI